MGSLGMSKYKHDILETKQDKIMIDIANELAERNRLFRVEYGVKSYAMETSQLEVDRTEKEWSDQA